MRTRKILLAILLFLTMPFSFFFAETVVLKGGKIRHVKVKKINLDTVFILNEQGKLESIPKKTVSKIVKKDRTGNESDLIVQDEFLRREEKLKSNLEKEKEKALNEEKEKYDQKLEAELIKERAEVAKKEKQKYEEQLKTELDKEHKESEQSFEAIKQKKAKEGKSKLGAKPSSENIATSNYFFSPSDTVVALAGPDAVCASVADKKQWFILFGTFPINKVKSAEIFKTEGQYRVYLKPTGFDIFASIFLAIFTSVTVKTVFIETCQVESIYILSENEVNTLIHKTNETHEANPNQPVEKGKIEVENKEVLNLPKE